MDKDHRFNVPEQYETERCEYIDDVSAIGYILRHKKSGARVCIMPCEDTNKLFCIAFYTPPDNDKGIPHIIEHTVLQGSRKYPAREPFMMLEKGSLHTFLNAMTYPDKTLYPVSSCNDADYKNLTDVYLDAVFFPALYNKREIFMQEGWHYEVGDDGELTVNGVVYSEMKGKSSSPDSNVFDELMRGLFPGSPYGCCSGGEPSAIPTLSYGEYTAFHKKYYHPSNCYIMIYGNVDPVERLSYLDREYLSLFDARPSIARVPPQKRSGGETVISARYPVGKDEDTANKTYLSWAALAGDPSDEVESAAWDVLGDYLAGDPASPLKKALFEAGIGQEVYGGYIDHVAEPFFAVIAKNADASDEERFRAILADTLEKLKTDGISERSINAYLERAEFKFRESAYGSFPKGLDLFRMMLRGWLYGDGDPFRYVRVISIIGELKKRVKEGYFESLIDRLIRSDHSVRLSLLPEPGLAEKEDENLSSQLESFKRSLSTEEFEKIKEDYEVLNEYIDAPETDEERSCIPVLPRGSISADPEPISNADATIGGVPAVIHEFPSNGIVYARFLFDLSDLSADDLPYLDLLIELLGNCSTSKRSYRDLIDEVRITTGGLDFDASVVRKYGSNDYTPYLTVSLRCLFSKVAESFDLLSEIVSDSDVTDKDRIKEILGQTVSSKARDILFSGDELAAIRCLSYTNSSSVFSDMTEGIGSYKVQEALYSDFDRSYDDISSKLSRLYRKVFDKNRLLLSVCAPDDVIPALDPLVSRIVAAMSDSGPVVPRKLAPYGPLNEAFVAAAQVQYVAFASDVKSADRRRDGLNLLLSKAASGEILYPEIRVKGGAYGSYCAMASDSAKVLMTSYRDPDLMNTVNVFKSIYEKLLEFRPDGEKLWQLVIGTFSRIDRPTSAYQKMCRSLSCRLTGKTVDDLAAERASILAVTPESFLKAAERLSDVKNGFTLCVIGKGSVIRRNSSLFGSVSDIFK